MSSNRPSGEWRDPSGSSLPPDRLWEVVNALSEATRDVAEYLNGRVLHPLEIHGGPLQPTALKEFTRFEVEEACRFLARLGLLDSAKPKAST